jgi:DNA-binding NarL/FixJ family response regulator
VEHPPEGSFDARLSDAWRWPPPRSSSTVGTVSTVSIDGPIKVMIASGSRPLRELLRRSLAQDERFVVVSEASDGDAIVARPETYELALVDLTVPGLGILGVLNKLRQRRPARSVVVMAYTDAIYLRNAVAAEGGADYVIMPDELEQLPDRMFRAVRPGLPVAS